MPKRTVIIGVAAFAMLALLIYGQSLTFRFTNLDDALLIYQNPKIWGLTARNVWLAFTTYDPELYIPLTLLSYQLTYTVAGLSPFAFHLGNLLLHLGNALMVTALMRRLLTADDGQGEQGNEARWLMAALAGALFLVHPLQTEAVVWAAARKDLLSAFFFLAATLGYLRFRDGGDRRWYAASLSFFVLGLMAKVSIVLLPFVLLLIDDLQSRRWDLREQIREKAPFFAVSFVFGVIALFGKQGASSAPFAVNILLFVKSLFFYPRLIAWPFGNSVLYPWTGDVRLSSVAFVVPALLLPLSLIVAWSLRRIDRRLCDGWLLYLVLLAPSFFNLTKGPDRYLGSDRYAYLALIGVLLAVASLVWQGWKRWSGGARSARIAAVGGVILVLLLAAHAHAQSLAWRSARTLYSTPWALQSHVAHLDIGTELRADGKLTEAIAEFDVALRLHPADEQAVYNKALTLEQQGHADEAIAAYRHALELQPAYAVARINLGRLLYERGDKTGAEREFLAAEKSAPLLAMPSFNVGVLAGERGDVSAAVEHYRAAIAKDPTLADARVNVIAALLKLQRVEDARAAFAELQRATPDDPRIPAIAGALGVR